MTVRTKTDCITEISNFFPIFHDAVISGNRLFWNLHAEQAYIFREGTRASMIRDYIVKSLRALLVEEKRTHIKDANQTTYFCIGKWIIIIHKIKENETVAVNRTNLSMALNDNDSQTAMQFSEESTILYLGYKEIVASRFEPEVLIACPDGAKPAWTMELKPRETPEPIEITPDTITPEPNRVRVMKHKNEENKEL